MSGIKISPQLRKKMPEEQREGIEDYLWSKSHERCFLCEEKMNVAADDIEADHNVPEAEGGTSDRDNLNLVHAACNRAKRATPSVDIRPYLKLAAFVRKRQNLVKYGECIEHFGITPKAVDVRPVGSDSIEFDFPDGRTVRAPVFVAATKGGSFRYCFIEVPRVALFNDNDCQPRNIKVAHVWSIYLDLQVNPLHEPPGCRLVKVSEHEYRLCMFDGQHKTVASWMSGHTHIVAKIYLDIGLTQTVRLVNSVQAKIKKLPLSPFELAAKLADEWQERLEEYETLVGSENATELGFIQYLPQQERNRGKQAFESALVQDLLTNSDLQLSRYVHRAGTPKTKNSLINEATFRNKVLTRLLHVAPLDAKGDTGTALRGRERDGICLVLNKLTELVFEPDGGRELTEAETERRRRMLYQSSLAYISDLLRKLVAHALVVDKDRAFLEKPISGSSWEIVSAGIERLVSHPIWTCDFNLSKKCQAVTNALSKNQNAEKSFGEVGLKTGYLVGADELSSTWYE
jgi:hypothetical protein